MAMDQKKKDECFQEGRDGERSYKAFSLLKGRTMIEVGALREKLGEGAPMIYLPKMCDGKDKLISPDFLTINTQTILTNWPCMEINKETVWTAQNLWDYPFLWNEVKTKQGCSWSRKYWCWQTGIDGYQLLHYRRVQKKTLIPVILFFLQVNDTTAQKNLPPGAGDCPKGIYACPVSWEPDATFRKARFREPYEYGCPVERADMVYWNIDRLIYVAPFEDIPRVSSRQVNSQVSSRGGIERAKQTKCYLPKVKDDDPFAGYADDPEEEG